MLEPSEALRFCRDLQAAARKIEDPESLHQLCQLRDLLDAEIVEGAQRLYAEGYSYAELAEPFGLARQTIAKRWPQRRAVS